MERFTREVINGIVKVTDSKYKVVYFNFADFVKSIPDEIKDQVNKIFKESFDRADLFTELPIFGSIALRIEESVVVGFLTVDFSEKDIGRIYNVATRLEYRGRGVASSLIKSVLAYPIPDVKIYWLNIVEGESSEKLIKLYSRASEEPNESNFIVVGRIRGDYSTDRGETSYIMTYVSGVHQSTEHSVIAASLMRSANYYSSFSQRKSIPEPESQIYGPIKRIDSGTLLALDFKEKPVIKSHFKLPGVLKSSAHMIFVDSYPKDHLAAVTALIRGFWDTDTRMIQYQNEKYVLRVSLTQVGFYLLRNIANPEIRKTILENIGKYSVENPMKPIELISLIPRSTILDYFKTPYYAVDNNAIVQWNVSGADLGSTIQILP